MVKHDSLSRPARRDRHRSGHRPRAERTRRRLAADGLRVVVNNRRREVDAAGPRQRGPRRRRDPRGRAARPSRTTRTSVPRVPVNAWLEQALAHLGPARRRWSTTPASTSTRRSTDRPGRFSPHLRRQLLRYGAGHARRLAAHARRPGTVGSLVSASSAGSARTARTVGLCCVEGSADRVRALARSGGGSARSVLQRNSAVRCNAHDGSTCRDGRCAGGIGARNSSRRWFRCWSASIPGSTAR